MQIIHEGQPVDELYAATIGFFDGVHLGHRFLLDQVKDEAKKRGLKTLAVTFSSHPRKVLCSNFCPDLLTTNEEKINLLSKCGIDACAVLDFTREFAAQTAETFMQVLAKDFGVRCLVIGHDHRFGCNRNKGFSEYIAYGTRCGIDVIKANALKNDDFTVSSSAIRRFLNEGAVRQAAQSLDRNYCLSGIVTEGRRIGRSIGFPTANLYPVSKDLLIPKNGVYAVMAHIGNAVYPAMANIGLRPTLDNGNDISIEAHLLDFSGDIYGAIVSLEFIDRIREERKFDNLNALQDQLRNDAKQTRQILNA